MERDMGMGGETETGEETETEVEGLVIIWTTEEDGHTANAACLILSGWI